MTHEQAIATRWTGTLYGPAFDDEHGVAWRQVFYYQAGRCVDAFVTRAGAQI
jgi:hypothetical protein